MLDPKMKIMSSLSEEIYAEGHAICLNLCFQDTSTGW